MNEPSPTPHTTRWMVWTDHRAGGNYALKTYNSATWFWSASGPRGHMSGAEGTAQAACERAWAAYQLLYGDQERKNDERAAA